MQRPLVNLSLSIPTDPDGQHAVALETLSRSTEWEWSVIVGWAVRVVALAEAVDQEGQVMVLPAKVARELGVSPAEATVVEGEPDD